MNVHTSDILISQAHAAVWYADGATIGIMSASQLVAVSGSGGVG